MSKIKLKTDLDDKQQQHILQAIEDFRNGQMGEIAIK